MRIGEKTCKRGYVECFENGLKCVEMRPTFSIRSALVSIGLAKNQRCMNVASSAATISHQAGEGPRDTKAGESERVEAGGGRGGGDRDGNGGGGISGGGSRVAAAVLPIEVSVAMS